MYMMVMATKAVITRTRATASTIVVENKIFLLLEVDSGLGDALLPASEKFPAPAKPLQKQITQSKLTKMCLQFRKHLQYTLTIFTFYSIKSFLAQTPWF